MAFAGIPGACAGRPARRLLHDRHAPADATAALIGFMINANKLAKASFEAKYGRKK